MGAPLCGLLSAASAWWFHPQTVSRRHAALCRAPAGRAGAEWSRCSARSWNPAPSRSPISQPGRRFLQADLARASVALTSSIAGGRLRAAAGPSPAVVSIFPTHLSAWQACWRGGCPWDPTVDSSLMLLMLQEEKTQHLECSREQRQGAGRILGIPSRAGLGVSRRRLQRQVRPWSWVAGLWGPHPQPCFPPPPELSGLFLSVSPSPAWEVSSLFGDGREAGWESVPSFLWYQNISDAR